MYSFLSAIVECNYQLTEFYAFWMLKIWTFLDFLHQIVKILSFIKPDQTHRNDTHMILLPFIVFTWLLIDFMNLAQQYFLLALSRTIRALDESLKICACQIVFFLLRKADWAWKEFLQFDILSVALLAEFHFKFEFEVYLHH